MCTVHIAVNCVPIRAIVATVCVSESFLLFPKRSACNEVCNFFCYTASMPPGEQLTSPNSFLGQMQTGGLPPFSEALAFNNTPSCEMASWLADKLKCSLGALIRLSQAVNMLEGNQH